jgi:hypothetical protein
MALWAMLLAATKAGVSKGDKALTTEAVEGNPPTPAAAGLAAKSSVRLVGVLGVSEFSEASDGLWRPFLRLNFATEDHLLMKLPSE